jgi:hypothetical protein
MTPTPPKRAAQASPGPAAAKSCPNMPSVPVAAGQGDPAASEHLEALAAGLDVPAAEATHTSSAAGSKKPGPAVGGEPVAGPGATLAETQRRQLAQIAAARATLARNRRNRRARPWQGRNRFSDTVPGVRVMPPPRDGA